MQAEGCLVMELGVRGKRRVLDQFPCICCKLYASPCAQWTQSDRGCSVACGDSSNVVMGYGTSGELHKKQVHGMTQPQCAVKYRTIPELPQYYIYSHLQQSLSFVTHASGSSVLQLAPVCTCVCHPSENLPAHTWFPP